MTAFIGLGAMGKHMARHLTCRLVSPATSYCGGVEVPASSLAAAASKLGSSPSSAQSRPSPTQQQQQQHQQSHPHPHPVRKCFVWNRTPSVAREHSEHSGSIFCGDVRELAQADVIFSCLPTSVEVSSVVDKMLSSLR